ncbi:MAG: tetratricopeptide repeat protein [Microcystaceae cyanobacterium]
MLSLTTALTPVEGLKSEVGSGKSEGEGGKENSALTSQKQTETIEQLFKQSITAYREGKYAEAEAIMRRVIELDPDNYRAYSNLGVLLELKGELKEAILAYKKAIEINPQHADAYNNLGVALYNNNQLEEAVVAYKKAIEINPQFAKAYYNLGNALQDKNQLEEAVVAYKKAIEINPQFAKAYHNLGNTLYKNNQLEEAITAYEKAIEINPQYAETYNNLGWALYNWALYTHNRLEEAIAAYEKAIEINPQYADAYNNLGLALYTNNNQLEEVIVAFQKSIEINPRYADAYNNLGWTLYTNNQLEEAIAAYETALEINPQYLPAYVNLGIALSDKNQLDKAIAAFKKVLSFPIGGTPTATSTPPQTIAHNGLGLVYQQQGKLNEAFKAYDAALKIDPNYLFAENNREEVLTLIQNPTELAYTNTDYLNPNDSLTPYKRSVVLLTPIFPQGRYNAGTGFIINRIGNKLLILTNHHVVHDKVYYTPPRLCDEVEIQFYIGDNLGNARVKAVFGQVIRHIEDPDLAIIEVEVPNLPDDIKSLPFSPPQETAKIFTIGHPNPEQWVHDEGEIIEISETEVKLKISLAKRSSGSPVITDYEKVIGVISKEMSNEIGFAIPSDLILEQLEDWEIDL